MKLYRKQCPANLKRAQCGAGRIREPLINFAEIRAENGQIRERSPDI